MTNQLVVAVDVGSGYTQIMTGGGVRHFPSVVCPASGSSGGDAGGAETVDAFGAEHAKIVRFDGGSWLVGEDAYAFGVAESRVNTLRNDWAGSPEWRAILYAALAATEVQRSDTVDLITGLPQALYAASKNDLLSLLRGVHRFSVGDTDYEVNIEPVVIPQAAAALISQARENPEIIKDSVGVIDIGTYTTGLSVVEYRRHIAHMSGGCAMGVSNLTRAVSEHLQREHRYTVDPIKIPMILTNGVIRRRGERIEVADDVAHIATMVAKPMLDNIQRLWRSVDDLLIYVGGGGAPFFLDPIKSLIPHATLMNDPFNAVVKGMYYRLDAQRRA